MSEEFQGVTEGASSSAGMADTSPAVTPTVETQQNEGLSQGEMTGAGTAPAVEGSAEPEIDLASIQPEAITDEQARKAFIHMRQGLRDAEDYRNQWTSATDWVAQRGGLEPIQSDVQMMDGLFAGDFEARVENFYRPLAQQNPQVYERIMEDFSTVPDMQDKVLQLMGVSPEDLPSVKDAIARGTWRDGAANASGALVELDDPNLRGVYNALGTVERRIADSLYGEELSAYLQDQGYRLAAQAYERQQAQQAQQAAIAQQKTATYQNVRGVVEKAVANLFPNDTNTVSLVLAGTEAELFGDAQGAALWAELERHIENGESRMVQAKLPQIIAKAQAIATKQAKGLSDMHEKARKFDELMRMGNEQEIADYFRRVRGSGQQPGQGVPVSSSNGRTSLPKPADAGKFDPANVLSYFPRN